MNDDLNLDEIINALSNPARREILAWLKAPEQNFAEQTDSGVCVGRIFERAGLSQSTISAHMATLQRAGLVVSTRVGQWVYYKRDEKTIKAFLAALKTEL
jgi:DNA-binding transcriptional ArsR family regulator